VTADGSAAGEPSPSTDEPAVTLADIQAAQARIAGRVHVSPCTASRAVSEATGARVSFKLENLQPMGSFKERGACNRLLRLTADERQRGVIAASAGNHALGVAYHAQALGIPATIVMPASSPLIKVTQTRALGATVVQVDGGYDAAWKAAQRLAAERNLVVVHAFDDRDVIAGQGTMGLEIVEQVPDLDALLIAVGGGGMVAGVATALKALRPSVRVIGVQSEAMPGMRAALREGCPVRIEPTRTIADGIAVGLVGALPYPAVCRYVDEVVTVDDEEIAEAILTLLEREKTVAEGAGAAPLAALYHRDLGLAGKNVVVVVGGGNIDVNVLSRIIDRGLMKSGRIMRTRIMLPDRPGSLAQLLAIIADKQANVLAIDHDRRAARLALGQTFVDVEAETRGFEHVTEIVEALRAKGFVPAA